MCSGSDNAIDETSNELRQQIRDKLYGASEQFVDDLVFIYEKTENDIVVKEMLNEYFVSEFSLALTQLKSTASEIKLLISYLFQFKELPHRIPKEKNTKIDVESMREYYTRRFGHTDKWLIAKLIDGLKALQTKLSMDIPSERLNGIMNLIFLVEYPNATTEEIESNLVTNIYMRHLSTRNRKFIDK